MVKRVPFYKDSESCLDGDANDLGLKQQGIDVSSLSDSSFDEWYFQDLFMHDGSMSELVSLTKEFAMVSGDGDVGVPRNRVEERFQSLFNPLEDSNLALLQLC